MYKAVVIFVGIFAVVYAKPGYLNSALSSHGVDIVHPQVIKSYAAPYHGGYGYGHGYGHGGSGLGGSGLGGSGLGYGHGLGYGYGHGLGHGYATSYSNRIDVPTHSVPVVTGYKHLGHGYPSYGHLGYEKLGYGYGGWAY